MLGFGGNHDELWRDIHAAFKQLNTRKLRADIRLVDAQVREILPDYENGAIDDDFFAHVGKLQATLAGVERRARRMGDQSLIDLCQLSENILADIKERPSPPNLRNVGALPKLVTGFKFALSAIIWTPFAAQKSASGPLLSKLAVRRAPNWPRGRSNGLQWTPGRLYSAHHCV